MTDVSERYVSLTSGLVLPVEPCLLALDLEARGFTLTREHDDVLSVQPHQRLTPEDCVAIRRWKLHLLAIVDYVHEATQ
jgi:hypothetical protein